MRRQQGFTLTELVMVIILVSIMAAYAASRFDRAAYDSEAVAIELIEAVRYAQAMAMAHSGADSDGDGNLDRYRINLTTTGYTIVVDDANSANLGNVANPADGSASYSQSWSSGVTLNPSEAAISFNHHGEPVGLASNATIGINSEITLTVERLTGYVRR